MEMYIESIYNFIYNLYNLYEINFILATISLKTIYFTSLYIFTYFEFLILNIFSDKAYK